MVFNTILTLFRNYVVFVIILFITTSGFIAGFLLNEYSNDTQDLKEEANDLYSKAEAIFSKYSSMVNFETTQLNMVREPLRYSKKFLLILQRNFQSLPDRRRIFQ